VLGVGNLVQPNECQLLLADLLGKGRIQFETARADIRQESYGLLDNLVYITKKCPASNVEIAGHTDADGQDDYNLDLSRRRAQAVADYLTKAGIDARRLTSVGYGKTRPIAANDSDENKALNRRIEFIVK
jgi:OmpA-OmpF porin, OOP family